MKKEDIYLISDILMAIFIGMAVGTLTGNVWCGCAAGFLSIRYQ